MTTYEIKAYRNRNELNAAQSPSAFAQTTGTNLAVAVAQLMAKEHGFAVLSKKDCDVSRQFFYAD